jgi:hypothetical protein
MAHVLAMYAVSLKKSKFTTMTKIPVPTRNQVSFANQALFDIITKNVGKAPNLWAAMTNS